MNLIKQYAIAHDLSIDEVEHVAHYLDPLMEPEQFSRELESIRVIDTDQLNRMFDESFDFCV